MGCKCIRQEQDINKDFNIEYTNNIKYNKNIKPKIEINEHNSNYLNESSNNLSNLFKNNNSIRKQSYIKNYNTTKDKSDSSPNSISPQKKRPCFDIYRLTINDTIKEKVLNEINYARAHPRKIAQRVRCIIPNIKIINQKPFLKLNDTSNLRLYQGITAFENCIKFLNNVQQLPNLEYKEELNLEFPDDNPAICENESYLTKILTKKKYEIKKFNLEIINFHYDTFTLQTELSVLMQIVDDTNSSYHRRNNIFNAKGKYIGISYGQKSKLIYCFYFLFAKDIE